MICEQCRRIATRRIEDIGLCPKHYGYFIRDVELLLKNRREVTFKIAADWLEKNKDNYNYMFINGYFNQYPEKLMLNDKVLNSIDIKKFAIDNHVKRSSTI